MLAMFNMSTGVHEHSGILYQSTGTKPKYILLKDYTIDLNLMGTFLSANFEINRSDKKVRLSKGVLTVFAGFSCDGPSGLSWDTETFMRGAFVHDAFYALIRECIGRNIRPKSWSIKAKEKYRAYADRLLRDICKDDGMCAFRAWYVYQAVNLFGASSAGL